MRRTYRKLMTRPTYAVPTSTLASNDLRRITRLTRDRAIYANNYLKGRVAINRTLRTEGRIPKPSRVRVIAGKGGTRVRNVAGGINARMTRPPRSAFTSRVLGKTKGLYTNRSYAGQQNIRFAGYAIAGGTVLYGLTDRVAKPSRTRAGKGYKRVAYMGGRAAAIVGHGAYGTASSFGRTGSPGYAVSTGINRGVKAAHGVNPATGHRTTLAARQRRNTIRTNAANKERELRKGPQSQAERSAAARKASRRRRRIRGRFA